MLEPNLITAVPLVALVMLASIADWRERRIPNVLTFGGAVLGVVSQAALLGPIGVASAIAGWTLCLVCFLPFYMSRGMAAGDVKLMAAVGAFLGPIDGLAACLLTLIAGALIAFACLASQRVARLRGGEAVTLRADLRQQIPYAAAIAIGAIAALLEPQWILPALRQSGALA